MPNDGLIDYGDKLSPQMQAAIDRGKQAIRERAAAMRIARIKLRSAPTYEQGVAAGLEMAAKVAENMTAEDRQQGALAHDHGLSLASVAWKIQAMTKEKIASAIRALADQHKPSPAADDVVGVSGKKAG